jgi:3-hydroxyacyl-[acyl-carrier-protein] dehydratase
MWRSPDKANHDTRQGVLFFDPGDRIYADHFPGRPVVPGSLIIHAFMLAARALKFVEAACSIEKFRFRKFISPGEYPYQIEMRGHQLRCTLYDGPTIVATGTFLLKTLRREGVKTGA